LAAMARGRADDADGPECGADPPEDVSEAEGSDGDSTRLGGPPTPPHELAFGLASEDDGAWQDAEETPAPLHAVLPQPILAMPILAQGSAAPLSAACGVLQQVSRMG